ncbi:ester cyclase [Jatrophihabitans sp. YIM 134969]
MSEDAAPVRALYDRYVAALNAHDAEAAFACVAPELTHNGVHMTAQQWWDDHVGGNIAKLPDYRWNPDEVVVTGDRVLVRYTDTGTLAAPWVGIEAVGERIEFREYVFYTVRDDRIVEVWSVFDHWSLVQRFGRTS